MTVLAITTSTGQVGVALGGPSGVVASLRINQGRRHGETLAPAIDALLRMSSLTPRDLTLVAVDRGPGLFTGLRVGVATAKATADALGIPLASSTSLELLARPFAERAGPVMSVVDAKRGEVFWALFERCARGMELVGEPDVATPAGLAAEVGSVVRAEGSLLLVGEGARRYLAELVAHPGVEMADPGFDHPSPDVLVELSGAAVVVEPALLMPLYLRGADVRLGWEQRDR